MLLGPKSGQPFASGSAPDALILASEDALPVRRDAAIHDAASADH